MKNKRSKELLEEKDLNLDLDLHDEAIEEAEDNFEEADEESDLFDRFDRD